MKKIKSKSFAITLCFVAVLVVVILIEISIFISGPLRKYEDKISVQESKIQETYKEIQKLQRHVFNYVVYVGEDSTKYVWFNEEGKAITSRKKETYKKDEIVTKATKEYGVKNIQVSLGYGYNNPVYIVECDKGTILFDYDTLKEVYYLMEGTKS